MKRILVLSIIDVNYLKYNGIYNDLFKELGKNNIVDIVSISNMNEEHYVYTNNINIYRVESKEIFNVGKIRKAYNLLTLNKRFKKTIKKHLKNNEYDMILYSTPPITINSTIKYVKEEYKAKTYLLLKDIFPQNAVDLNMMSNKGLVHKYFKAKENNLYKISDYIGVMSPKNREFIVKNNNVNPNKIEINPNSIKISNRNLTEKLEKEKILRKYNLPIDKTKFIYGGNLGIPQGIDYICDVILLNEKTNNHIVIVGEGTEKGKLVKFLDGNKIKNTTFISKLNKREYDRLLEACDVGLIFLDNRFTIPNIPSRLLSYLEYSKPVIAATDKNTDLKEIIEEGRFGYWCESKHPEVMIDLFYKIKEHDNIQQMGGRGRVYLKKHYNIDVSSNLILSKLKEG